MHWPRNELRLEVPQTRELTSTRHEHKNVANARGANRGTNHPPGGPWDGGRSGGPGTREDFLSLLARRVRGNTVVTLSGRSMKSCGWSRISFVCAAVRKPSLTK
ncbi:succinate-semialdehyde dehdyrogenase [Anopheles sinensis]|uniref:Succinate-semialdehyde dehdyrogenase n=1 Tax=Anopheles sinensis TaxID=74873 RepID=A0A084WTC9_ANOSI|nr:succinate-semialdehyde dehdyrogenase [Anopheles sinensis]